MNQTPENGKRNLISTDPSTNDPIFRKLSDGRTDGETDESDFIGRCRLTSSTQN